MPTVGGKLTPEGQQEWLNLVEECFRAKGTPRTYFSSQLHREPQHTVLVARSLTTEHSKMVSTVRIFHRVMVGAEGHKMVKVGGFGAVCTLPEYRNLGISSQLLKFALQTMVKKDSAEGFEVALLHSHPKFHSFYSKCGFSHVLPIQSVTMDITAQPHSNIRSFDPTIDICALAHCHACFQQTGTDVRTSSLWSMLEKEFGDSFFVALDACECVQAYCCVKYSYRDNVWILSDFGIDDCDSELTWHLLEHAIYHTMTVSTVPPIPLPAAAATAADASTELKNTSSMKNTTTVVNVLLCVGDLLPPGKHQRREQMEDRGWLYHCLNGSDDPFEDKMTGKVASGTARWKLDAF